jgi:hypothetical protein
LIIEAVEKARFIIVVRREAVPKGLLGLSGYAVAEKTFLDSLCYLMFPIFPLKPWVKIKCVYKLLFSIFILMG